MLSPRIYPVGNNLFFKFALQIVVLFVSFIVITMLEIFSIYSLIYFSIFPYLRSLLNHDTLEAAGWVPQHNTYLIDYTHKPNLI